MSSKSMTGGVFCMTASAQTWGPRVLFRRNRRSRRWFGGVRPRTERCNFDAKLLGGPVCRGVRLERRGAAEGGDPAIRILRAAESSRRSDPQSDVIAELAEDRRQSAGIYPQRPARRGELPRLERILYICVERAVEGEEQLIAALGRVDLVAERSSLLRQIHQICKLRPALRRNAEDADRPRHQLVDVDVVQRDGAAVRQELRDLRAGEAIEIADEPRRRGERGGEHGRLREARRERRRRRVAAGGARDDFRLGGRTSELA